MSERKRKIMKCILNAILLCCSMSLSAQEKVMFEINADLNKDGISDLVKVVNPRDPEKLQIREMDGYEYDFNQPILSIYLGQQDGSKKLHGRYDNCMPYADNEFVTIDNLKVSVSEKGVISIDFTIFASAGSYSSPTYKYLYRYQNGDFYLIGEDCSVMARNTGMVETVSINYLTHKKQTVTESAFDENVPKKEKWSKVPTAPLKKLGSFQMGY